jgi:hypothetical protein
METRCVGEKNLTGENRARVSAVAPTRLHEIGLKSRDRAIASSPGLIGPQNLSHGPRCHRRTTKR